MALADVVDTVAGQAEDFVVRVCAIIRAQYPAYLPPGPDGFDPLVIATRRNFLDALHWIRSEEALAEADLSSYRTAFLRNAYRHATVTDVLGSLRLGFQEIWLALDDADERAGRDGDDLRVLTSRLWRAYEGLAGVAAEAYSASQRQSDVARQRDLLELWRHLDRPDGTQPAAALAARLGVDADAHFVAWASSPSADLRSLMIDGAESVLLPDHVVGFVAGSHDVSERLLAQARATGVVCGIGSWRAGLGGLHQSAIDARRALPLAQATGRAARFRDDVIGCLAFDPTLGLDEAVAPVERAVRADPGSCHQVLRYLGNGRALRATARELGVHPNTLAYRVQRFWQHTGLDPDRTDDLVLLAIAAHRAGAAGAPI